VTLVNKVYGNYMGYMDFDQVRYFDVRKMDNYPLEDLPRDSKDPICLTSDSRNRADLTELDAGRVEQAQTNKNMIENI